MTANKALLATHGGELAELAERRVAALLGSASVGGGTPMIEIGRATWPPPARSSASAALRERHDDLHPRRRWAEGRTYDEALREAQEAGYAEADPSFDVDGRDAAQKLAILASVAWGRWRPEADVATTGIVGSTWSPRARPSAWWLDATRDALDASGRRSLEAGRCPGCRAPASRACSRSPCATARSFRVSGPGAGGRVTAGAVYADVARLVAGERPILFGRPLIGYRVSSSTMTDWHWPTVGVAGARGVVGGVFCSILADAGLPAECLRAFGHEEGNALDYRGASVPVHVLDRRERARELDVLFLAVDGRAEPRDHGRAGRIGAAGGRQLERVPPGR